MKSTTKRIFLMIILERNKLMWLDTKRKSSICSWLETRIQRVVKWIGMLIQEHLDILLVVLIDMLNL
jgi:hypothetical protein